MGRVFIIDDEKPHITPYPRLLEEKGFEVFATENAFKLIRYAPELKPEMYVINADMKKTDYVSVVGHLVENHFTDTAPLVVLSGNYKDVWLHGVSHYLQHKESRQKLPLLAKTYCGGGRYYDLLLLEDFLPEARFPHLRTKELKISYFTVFDVSAARVFLQKNKTSVVAIHCLSERYEELKRMLNEDNVFYVENLKNFKDLVSFIK